MKCGWKILAVMALAVAGGGRMSWGQMVRLRATTTVDMHQDVRLADMAVVTAEDPKKAEELANTVIVTDVEKAQKIKAEAVLMALMAQGGTAVLGANFQMGGAAVCELVVAPATRAAADAAAPAPAAATNKPAPAAVTRPGVGPYQPVALGAVQIGEEIAAVATAAVMPVKAAGKTAEATPEEGDTKGPMMLRQVIFALVQQGLAVREDDIKVTLDSINPLIDEPLTGNRKWQCRPLTRTFLGTVPFEAQLTDGVKVLEKFTVVAQVRQRQMVVALKAPLRRHDVVLEDQVQMQEAWPDRKLATRFSRISDVVGLEAQADLAGGTQLDQRDFKPHLMAHRNDLVTVIYAAGTLEVQTQGRALEDGKLHQTIALRNDSTGKDFTAYLVGKSKAVVGTLTAEQEKRIREAE
jgi:flagella basal body P-ring formation protein FlgA